MKGRDRYTRVGPRVPRCLISSTAWRQTGANGFPAAADVKWEHAETRRILRIGMRGMLKGRNKPACTCCCIGSETAAVTVAKEATTQRQQHGNYDDCDDVQQRRTREHKDD